jgi:SAM-dependent methyltransferase
MTVELQRSSAARLCAETFNAALAAEALSAAWELGLLDELRREAKLDLRTYARDNDLHLRTLTHLARALANRQIIDLDDHLTEVTPGLVFEDAYQAKGFFYWLTRGCGDLLERLPEVTHLANRDGDYARRDPAAISVACRDISRSFFDPPFQELLADVSFDSVADFGCGSGDRLITLATQRPHVRAIGIDIAADALTVARDAVAAAGVRDRVRLVHDDVLNLSARPEYQEVDLATCFLMGHDFWPRENCVRTLRGLRQAFPRLRTLILGDTCRAVGEAEWNPPVFTLGFETVHAIMDKYLPTLQEWYDTIAESGWRIANQRHIDLPAFSFIFQLTPADDEEIRR